tara:strand:+ start:1428 stop:1679 length:252 start_codon:yes stop_codon:yes gene_type:complete
MAKPKKEGGPKQQLSPIAARKKARRDYLYAMTPRRRAMKAESQRINCKEGQDYDHNTKKCVSSSHNRGGTQSSSKKDGTKAES